MSNLFEQTYNPDVLSCLANLSNDEVFTPPEIANQVLDMLPEELWSDPDATFLDPACKSGVFLREIAKRLIKGLEDEFPDLQERLEHIYKKQLFGIAITELTSLLSRRSLYCSKYPNSVFSVVRFEDAMGNIRFKNIDHDWVGGRCLYCGASQKEYERDGALEQHAYEFIHLVNPNEVFNMKFDVIIGNPPYQLSDGGAQASAMPLYQKFVEQAKKLKPRYLTMIIPARWYGGGKGLDDFRQEMISDLHIRELHDYLNAADCFPGVEIKGGICYFLWDREHEGFCAVFTHKGNDVVKQEPRFLKEAGSDVFIRHGEGVSIFRKVASKQEKTFDALVSSQKPFGLRTYVRGTKRPTNSSIKLYERGGVGYIDRDEVNRNRNWIDTPKVYISAAYGAGEEYPHQILGKPIIGETGSACTETYLHIGPFSSEDECENVCSYIRTKLFRFLVMLKKTSQHAAASVYSFVPIQDFSHPWTDEMLYDKYGISERERESSLTL